MKELPTREGGLPPPPLLPCLPLLLCVFYSLVVAAPLPIFSSYTLVRAKGHHAAKALRGTFEAVRAGASAEALDLVYRPSADPEVLSRFWSEATGWKPFDVGNIEAMGPHDRAFAQMVLITRLTHRDVNVLPAMRALAVPGWAAHVRAALPSIEAKHPDIAAAYRAALA